MLENQAVKKIRSANESIQPGAAALAMLRRWFVESKGTVNVSMWLSCVICQWIIYMPYSLVICVSCMCVMYVCLCVDLPMAQWWGSCGVAIWTVGWTKQTKVNNWK